MSESTNNSGNKNEAAAYVVADIGGTNARFAVHSVNGSGEIELQHEAQFLCADFNSLSEVFDAYCQQLGRKITGASIAIAGPTDVEVVRMTNLGWSFSQDEFRRRHGLDALWCVNDAAAAALATTCAGERQLEVVKPGQPEAHAARINLIPGTGFGIGTILQVNGEWVPVPGEGGHATLAAVSDEEFAVLQQITRRFGRAINDLVLSGPGMLNIYQALAEVRGEQPLDNDARALTRRALDGTDPLSVDCLDMYCTLLGRLAGDLALTLNIHGGVYLSGSLLRKVGADRLRSPFGLGFTDKGKLRKKIERVPVFLLQLEHPCLLGASVWMQSHLNKVSGKEQ